MNRPMQTRDRCDYEPDSSGPSGTGTVVSCVSGLVVGVEAAAPQREKARRDSPAAGRLTFGLMLRSRLFRIDHAQRPRSQRTYDPDRVTFRAKRILAALNSPETQAEIAGGQLAGFAERADQGDRLVPARFVLDDQKTSVSKFGTLVNRLVPVWLFVS